MKEIWKDVVDYEGFYMVSNKGRLKSLPRNGTIKKERLIKICNFQFGYLGALLHKKGDLKNVFIHRLVAIAFIPNTLNLPQVNHKDGNKKNNNLNNLEWCTAKQNTIHAEKIGLRVHRKGPESKISKPIQQIINGDVVAEYYNGIHAAEAVGCCTGSISLACRTQRPFKGSLFLFKNT